MEWQVIIKYRFKGKYSGKQAFAPPLCLTGHEQTACWVPVWFVCSWSCMQSEARGEGDLWTNIEPVCISIEENNHYIHYGLSEST